MTILPSLLRTASQEAMLRRFVAIFMPGLMPGVRCS
ncbi:hypothetical protein [Bacteriophage sp.]|nr:hypothetical protein [Bacteriophage sp.]